MWSSFMYEKIKFEGAPHSVNKSTTHHECGSAELVDDVCEVAVFVLGRDEEILLPQGVHCAVLAGNLNLSITHQTVGHQWVLRDNPSHFFLFALATTGNLLI